MLTHCQELEPIFGSQQHMQCLPIAMFAGNNFVVSTVTFYVHTYFSHENVGVY